MLMLNLMGNALKYSATEAEPVVELLQVERDGRSWMCVRDNGVGFDPETVSHAHDDRRFGIFGVREQLGRHGGRLVVESQPGTGTAARVSVPIGTERNRG